MSNKIKVLDEYTFSITDEDHTLMNPLQWSISQDKSVDICGYTIPHPSENIATLRIQFKDENRQNKTEKKDTLIEGCDRLERIINEMMKQLEDTK
ncbi:polymerase subunit AC19 [Spraguea lophii 42_110]|uniref:Polymerase subunit AC19 n=1 Tax=Spraguea lophii (strain 42_110) TaxID=1358809 RepID=S7W9T0_SPRLO|nr:polymerase subunit AC19 [Spraguea lophii 42_110]